MHENVTSLFFFGERMSYVTYRLNKLHPPSPRRKDTGKCPAYYFLSFYQPSSWQNEPFDTGGVGGVCLCNYTEIVSKLPETLRGLPGPIGEMGVWQLILFIEGYVP